MAYSDLRDFAETLEDKDELVRVEREVDPELEISEITDRVSRRQPEYNKALWFEDVVGSDYPVLINAMGSRRRMELSLEVDELDEVADRIREIMGYRPPETGGIRSAVGNLGEIKEGFDLLRELRRYPPKKAKARKAPCKQVVDHEPDLDELPVLKCWPGDGGRFITLPLVTTKDEDGRNVGVYRMQVYDSTHTGMHWQMHKHGAQQYRDSDDGIEAAVAIGSDPATVYSATAPLPFDVDEYLLAGFLRREGVRLVDCETVDLRVPANAEIVLEGRVLPETRPEGPFGDHTGYYTPVEEFPVFEVDCVTRRENPVYHTTIVGKPPQEDAYLGKATERIFLPLIQTQFDEVVDVDLPIDGVFHNLLLVSIDKRYPGHARKVMMGMMSLGMLSLTKAVVVVDDDVDVHDAREVVWAVTSRFDASRDIEVIERAPLDHLEHAAPRTAYGGKVGLDATVPWPEEGFERDWPDEIEMDEDVKERVDEMWSELGIEEAVNESGQDDDGGEDDTEDDGGWLG
ncbi:MAG: menaquinone biosynthesis decarboxylase [Halobacteriota archaeon]